MSDPLGSRLPLAREQILGFRRAAGALDQRLSHTPTSLRRAAWAGLQDSVPRSALLSLHARIDGIRPADWGAPSLAQVWGPRYTAYVIPAGDRAVFTLGRLPDDARGRARAHEMATRLREHLGTDRCRYDDVGRALGVNHNALRYAAPTGTVLIRWGGAHRPEVWVVPAPDVDPAEARLELLRRFLHVHGPGTPASFAQWAGVSRRGATSAFTALGTSVLPVSTPTGDAWILTADEEPLRGAASAPAPARLLPSGDPYVLHQEPERGLLVGDPGRRARLWPSRVWPGALLVEGEICGTWRRADATVTIDVWDGLSSAHRDAVEAEARSLPLPGLDGPIDIRWEDEQTI